MVLLCGMSSTDPGEEIREKSLEEILEEEITCTDSEESFCEEEISSEIYSDPEINLKRISLKKYFKNSNDKARKEKSEFCKVNVSVRCGKRNRFLKTNKKPHKIIQKKICRKSPLKEKICVENPVETLKKGKRCRIGGKAKGKPPEEENNEKCQSDEESENYFFSRISLGYFQKYKDLSGASTSNQWEEEHKKFHLSNNKEKIRDEISEEMELLELQNWGMGKSDKLERMEYLNRNTF